MTSHVEKRSSAQASPPRARTCRARHWNSAAVYVTPEFCFGCPFDLRKIPIDAPEDAAAVLVDLVASFGEAQEELGRQPKLERIRKGIDAPTGAHELVTPRFCDYRTISSPTDLSRALYVNDVRPVCPGVRLLFDCADREFFAGLMLQALETPEAEPPAKWRRRRGPPLRKLKCGRRLPPPPAGADLFSAFGPPG